MKKLLTGCLLLCSVGAYAEETHELPPIQGWWPDTQSFSSLVSGVVQPQVNNGMTPYGTSFSMVAHAQMVAAQEAAKKAEKEAKRRQCISDAQTMNNNSYDDVSQRLTDQTADCQFAFSHEPEAMSACSTQAYGHYEGSLESLNTTLELKKEYCEKLYGN